MAITGKDCRQVEYWTCIESRKKCEKDGEDGGRGSRKTVGPSRTGGSSGSRSAGDRQGPATTRRGGGSRRGSRWCKTGGTRRRAPCRTPAFSASSTHVRQQRVGRDQFHVLVAPVGLRSADIASGRALHGRQNVGNLRAQTAAVRPGVGSVVHRPAFPLPPRAPTAAGLAQAARGALGPAAASHAPRLDSRIGADLEPLYSLAVPPHLPLPFCEPCGVLED